MAWEPTLRNDFINTFCEIKYAWLRDRRSSLRGLYRLPLGLSLITCRHETDKSDYRIIGSKLMEPVMVELINHPSRLTGSTFRAGTGTHRQPSHALRQRPCHGSIWGREWGGERGCRTRAASASFSRSVQLSSYTCTVHSPSYTCTVQVPSYTSSEQLPSYTGTVQLPSYTSILGDV